MVHSTGGGFAQLPELGRGNYLRRERRLLRPDQHWVALDGYGQPVSLTVAVDAASWVVLRGAAAVSTVTGVRFEVDLRPGLTLLELHELAGRKAGGVPPQCLQLALGAELLGLGDVAAASRLASAAGVHEGAELMLAVQQRAEGPDGVLGLPADAGPGARAVARVRRAKLQLLAAAPVRCAQLGPTIPRRILRCQPVARSNIESEQKRVGRSVLHYL
jgi:hypothetical protein